MSFLDALTAPTGGTQKQQAFTGAPDLSQQQLFSGATDAVNRRVYGLLASGHQWMGLPTLYSFASSGISDNDLNYLAEKMRKLTVNGVQANALGTAIPGVQKGLNLGVQTLASSAQYTSAATSPLGESQHVLNQQQQQVNHIKGKVAQADDGFKHLFDDPVLQKNPSAGLALQRWMSGVLGPVPVGEKDLKHMQQQLQVQGYGRDLQANGVNSQGWNGATAQWRNDVFNRQLAGEKPGSLSVGHAMQALQALTPTSAWNALIGYAKALPDGARQLVGDIAGGGVQLGADLIDPQFYATGHSQNQAAGYGANAAVVNVLGGDTSEKQVQKGFEQQGALRLLEDTTNLVMASSLLGSASRFGQAAGTEIAASTDPVVAANISKEAAFKGPGVIARSLSSEAGTGSPLIPRALLGAGVGGGGTALAGGTPKQIAAGAFGGAAIGALSTTNVFQNIPVLGRTGPLIDSLTDGSGLYYKVRQFVHAPYTWVAGPDGAISPIQGAIGSSLRLGDTAFQSSILEGAKIRGAAQLQDWVGGDQSTPLSQQVSKTHTLDAVNDALKQRLGFTVFGQHIAPSIDDLMFTFNGAGAKALDQNTSKILEQHAATLSEMSTDALGQPGFAASIVHATGKSMPRLIKEAGGLENFNQFWSAKVAEHAVAFESENRLKDINAAVGDPAMGSLSDLSRAQQLQQIQHEIWQDPAQLQKAITDLRAQAGGEEFTARLKRDIAYGMMSPRGAHGNIPDLISAQKIVRNEVMPHVGTTVPVEVPITTPIEAALPGAAQQAVDLTATVHQNVIPNGTLDKGAMGLANLDYHTEQDANKAINGFAQRNAELKARANPSTDIGLSPAAQNLALASRPSIEEWNQLESDMFDYLHKELGVHKPDMPQITADEMIPVMREQAKLLASDIYIHPDAPQQLHDAVTKLEGLNKKLVRGTDIGHGVALTSPADPMEGPITWQRNLAEHLGLNPTTVPDANIATHRWVGMTSQIQRSIDKGRYSLPPGVDPVGILAYLRKEGVIEEGRGNLATALQTFGARKLAKTSDISIEDARKLMDAPVQMRDTARKKVVDALSGPTSGRKFANEYPASIAQFNRTDPNAYEQGFLAADKAGQPLAGYEVAPMSPQHANQLYEDIVRGSATPPAYLLGASRLEDLFRASMGFAGKAIPNNFGFAMANLPNKLIQIRNELRFDLSPAFSLRRWTKIQAKMAVEGINPVWDAAAAMHKAGTWEEDNAIFNRIRPQYASELEYADDADRYARSQDIFGLVNPAMHEARAAGIWARQGLSDDEINQKLIRTFEYGSGSTKGRSALERTTNFVFFPFSFDKTLYRNLGAYLLDAPAQRLVMTRALAAYDEFNKNHMDGSNPLATSFWTNHAPILNEITQLNAFAHGISVGEPGGINRPLLNMFLPQAWKPSQTTTGVLGRLAPAITDFQRVMNEANDQKNILGAEGHNLVQSAKEAFGSGPGVSYVSGGASNAPGPVASTLSKNADLEAGFTMYDKWVQDNQDYLDHNRHTTDQTNKYRFPQDPEWGRLAGQPITPDAIRQIVSAKHPAFGTDAAISIATGEKKAWSKFVLDSTGQKFASGQEKSGLFTQFATEVGKLNTGMTTPGAKTTALSAITARLRTAAIQMAQEDPEFYKMYNKNFRKVLGPLEAVKP